MRIRPIVAWYDLPSKRREYRPGEIFCKSIRYGFPSRATEPSFPNDHLNCLAPKLEMTVAIFLFPFVVMYAQDTTGIRQCQGVIGQFDDFFTLWYINAQMD